MIETTLTSKGQVTIPKKIRNIFGLKPKDKLIFIPIENEVIMRFTKGNVLDLRGIAKHKGGNINFKELRKEFEKDIARRAVEKIK